MPPSTPAPVESSMHRYSYAHIPDHVLIRDLVDGTASDCTHLADRLGQLGEVDARKLYLPAAYSSMFAYCLGELHLCEQAAYKRIHAARAARRFPAIFTAVAEDRLHLSAVVLLAAHLPPENVDELIAAATHRTKAEIEQLLAERFPRPDLPDQILAISTAATTAQLSPGKVEAQSPGRSDELSPGIVEPQLPARGDELSPGKVAAPAPVPPAHARVGPLAPQRFALQVTIGQSTYEKLQHVQALLGHANASRNLDAVLDRALDALARELDKRKFAATSKPRRPRPSHGKRHVPAAIKRAVWQRDGGRCTFVGEHGRRCEARTRLEFDHVEPVARGGTATLGGIRLRCRAHNQYQAEQTFGVGFMREKRDATAAQSKKLRCSVSALDRNGIVAGVATPCDPAG